MATDIPDFAELLAQAWQEFEPPLAEPLAEPGILIGHTAVAWWAQLRLLIWVCDRGQDQAQVLAEVASIGVLAPARRLSRVYKLKTSVAVAELLASLMVRLTWGFGYVRQVAAGDPRAAAVLTGLLVPSDDKELLRDLRVGQVTDYSEDSEDLRRTGVVGAVERESEMRSEDSARLVQWINERGLALSYPDIDGQSTRLGPKRWNEQALLAVLVDTLARMALPHSPKAGDVRRAAQWAVFHELERRDAMKRGKGAIEVPLGDDVASEAPFSDLDTAKVIALAEKHMGVRAARYFEGLAKGLSHPKAAAEAGISTSRGRHYMRQLKARLGLQPKKNFRRP
jgi:hypothetical protein